MTVKYGNILESCTTAGISRDGLEENPHLRFFVRKLKSGGECWTSSGRLILLGLAKAREVERKVEAVFPSWKHSAQVRGEKVQRNN